MNSRAKCVQLPALTALLLMVMVGCNDSSETSPDPEAVTAETARINAWFEEKFEEQLAFSPEQQTMLGRRTDYGRIDDRSTEGQEQELAWMRASTAEMESSFDYALLDDEAKTSWDVWAYQLRLAEAEGQFRGNAYVFEQMDAVHAWFPQLLIAFHEADSLADLEAYVSRIEESGRAMRQLIEVSRANAARGVRPPYFAYGFVIDEARKAITGVPFDAAGPDSDIWADLTTKVATLRDSGTIDDAEATRVLNDAREALRGPFLEAYAEMLRWLEEDRPNAEPEASGVDALPNGDAYYEERLAYWTTTSLTADEIHEIGLAEVARLREAMVGIKDEVGFDGDLEAFFAELRDNKEDRRYYYPDTDAGRQAYIDDATAAIQRIEAELPNYFGLLPKAGLEVRRVEPFREQPGAAQHYFPGTPDGSRPGIYYAHLSDMAAMPKRELEVIAYHEGLPGHHMQISIAQEQEGIPTFRTQAFFGAYIEGWALYSEALAKEMPGTYEDPYSEFGRLGSEIWRAIRLVVDAGLHSKGWSEEQAVEYFMANSAVTEPQARSEVRRYLVLPGQATSYKIGMLKIQELRARAEAALGEAFEIRAFHDVVLGGGALPLEVLEARVDRWIAAAAPN